MTDIPVVGSGGRPGPPLPDTPARALPVSSRPRRRSSGPDILLALTLMATVVPVLLPRAAWTVAFLPTSAILLALAGEATARVLETAPGRPGHGIVRGLLGSLPPLWILGVVSVAYAVWTVGPSVLDRSQLAWILPVVAPHDLLTGGLLGPHLELITALTWLTVLAPALVWLTRHWPRTMLVLPLVLTLLNATHIVPVPQALGGVVLLPVVLGTPWLIGVARAHGLLNRLPWPVVVPVCLLLVGASVGWAWFHRDPVTGWDLEAPINVAMVGTAGALLLMRTGRVAGPVGPDATARGGAATAVARRAVTLYLWLPPVVVASGTVADRPELRTIATDAGLPLPYARIVVGVLLFALVWLLPGAWEARHGVRSLVRPAPGGGGRHDLGQRDPDLRETAPRDTRPQTARSANSPEGNPL
ncbi:hypothetical protein [Raineyella sp.]|uniref:hypothetical protein n=1 Tax=Raineyella sp. TaxID=1911550 RepID=UPI002B220875|nr:hypothetical protein [Raineyella sp.]MEA5154647.1 hypothetical protein [Raineyella sp.]